MIDYRCKACGWWLCSSDASGSRITITCSNRRCQTRQTIVLDVPKPPALVKSARIS